MLCFTGLDTHWATTSAHVIIPLPPPTPASFSPYQKPLLPDSYPIFTPHLQSRYIHSLSAGDFSLTRNLLCVQACAYSKRDIRE